MRLWSRIIVGMAAMIMVAGSAIALPGGPAYASTGNACNTYSWGLVCVNITGTGLDVDSMKGWIRNDTSDYLPYLHIELWSSPHGLIKNCPTSGSWDISPDSNSPNCIWSPNAPETGGSYCVILWQLQGSSQVQLGRECVDVHS
jgi:hypothetical protein